MGITVSFSISESWIMRNFQTIRLRCNVVKSISLNHSIKCISVSRVVLGSSIFVKDIMNCTWTVGWGKNYTSCLFLFFIPLLIKINSNPWSYLVFDRKPCNIVITLAEQNTGILFYVFNIYYYTVSALMTFLLFYFKDNFQFRNNLKDFKNILLK